MESEYLENKIKKNGREKPSGQDEKIGGQGESSEKLGRGEEGGAWRHEVPSWARSPLPG